MRMPLRGRVREFQWLMTEFYDHTCVNLGRRSKKPERQRGGFSRTRAETHDPECIWTDQVCTETGVGGAGRVKKRGGEKRKAAWGDRQGSVIQKRQERREEGG